MRATTVVSMFLEVIYVQQVSYVITGIESSNTRPFHCSNRHVLTKLLNKATFMLYQFLDKTVVNYVRQRYDDYESAI